MIHVRVHVVDRGQRPPIQVEDPDGVLHLHVEEAVVLQAGTREGNATVALVGTMDGGRRVVLETTAKILDTVVAASRGARMRWGEAVER